MESIGLPVRGLRACMCSQPDCHWALACVACLTFICLP